MLRGEDVGAFYPNFKDLYLINFHNGIKARNDAISCMISKI